jgi:hypothetical protein
MKIKYLLSIFLMGVCVALPAFSLADECSTGIKLNTNVPFIGNCLSLSNTNTGEQETH